LSITIDQAFTDTLMTGGLAIDLVHENGAYSVWGGSAYTTSLGVYEPQARREYAEAKHFPAVRSGASLSNSDEHLGLYQVLVKFPDDIADFTAKTKVEAVLALFKPTTLLAYGGQTVEILSSSRDGGVNNGGFYEIMIRANYRAFVAR